MTTPALADLLNDPGRPGDPESPRDCERGRWRRFSWFQTPAACRAYAAIVGRHDEGRR